MKPTYDSVSCTLEPNLSFTGGGISTPAVDCSNNIANYNTATKTWNCPWEINSKSDWLSTDGTKILVDTSKAPASATVYVAATSYDLWCACTDSTYTRYSSNFAYYYFQIQPPPPLTSVTSTQFS